MINKILQYLNLRDVGILEMLIALYPILAGYTYGVIKCHVLFLIIAALMALYINHNNAKPIKCTWLAWLIGYVAIHELFLMSRIHVESYFINNTISILICSITIIPIVKAIDYKKLVGSLNWVSIFVIIGLLTQISMVMAGQKVTPIKLPFMPDMDIGTRLYEERIRPSSFFWEPASLATFLMIPLFISLTQNRYIWSGVIIIAMFLSGSSTGILMSFCMLSVYVLTQKVSFPTRVYVIIFGIILFYILINSPYFEYGVNKIETTDPEKNARLMNGIFLFENMTDSDKVWGINAANINEFFLLFGGSFIIAGNGFIFVPTFWLMWAKYGIIGLAIFLGMYLSLLKQSMSLLPYMVVIFISMFFQSFPIGSINFAYQLIFLYSYIGNKLAQKDHFV